MKLALKRFLQLAMVTVCVSLILSGCGGGGGEGVEAGQPGQEETPTPPATAVSQPESQTGASTEVAPPSPTESQPAALTPDQLVDLQPNELGWIPVLQYHHFGDTPLDNFTRTPEQFEADLTWLYKHNFYVVNLHDYLNDTMEIPAGKHPVILTFDDGPTSQFSLIEQTDGQLAVDTRTAIGVLENFYRAHPDFGRGGHFAILPDRTFAWHTIEDRSDQEPYKEMKLKWLVDNGYEIGNHTLDHANLATITNEEVMYQLAEANDMILEQLPGAEILVVTLPYGGYPNDGDDTVFRGFEYNGTYYEYRAALLVGANPAFSVYSTEYDPYAIPRIQAFDEELDKWFSFMAENPGILYTSDGDSNTVTIPLELHWGLVDTFNKASVGDKVLDRY